MSEPTSDAPPRAVWLTLLPGVGVLRSYERSWLRPDVLAGVTVAAYLIPQVMAYSEVARLSPVVGLWAITGALAAYVILGSSRQISVGPESTTALMTAVAVAPLAVGDPSASAGLAVTLALLVGIVCVLAFVLRMGFLADLLSKPVLIGYLAGVAVIMIVSQLGRVTGVSVPAATNTLAELVAFVRVAGGVHWPTLLVATVAFALLQVASARFRRVPVPLIVVLLAAGAVAVFGLDESGVAVVGPIASGVPVPQLTLPDFDTVATLILPAVGIAIVGYSDNILTARAFAARNGYDVDANQELLALGGANIASAAMSGFPVSSSGSRTVIADSLGSKTQVYSIVALVTVVVTLFFGRGVLALFPRAALGALVVWAALRLIEVAEFRRLARFRRSELVLAMVTAGAVLTLDILYGVLVAVGLSLFDLLRRVSRPHDAVLGYAPGMAGMHDVADYAGVTQIEGLVIYRYDSPLYFANAEDFRRRATLAVTAAPTPTRWFVLNAEGNTAVDLTSVDALDEVRRDLAGRGVTVGLARVTFEVAADLRRAGWLDAIGADRVFATLPTAVAAYVEWFVTTYGRRPEGAPPA